MCRLFGIIANQTVKAESFLLTAPYSLLTQSHIDKKRKQGDGWGIGWFNGGPKVYKSSRAIYQDYASPAAALRPLPAGEGWGEAKKSRTLIGHVRWASNPLKLKRDELIGLAHTQPFTHGKWIFAHNGTLYIPTEVAAELGPWKKYIKGKNDSEVLFYWILKHLVPSPVSNLQRTKHRTLDFGPEIAKSIRRSIKNLDKIWNKCKKSYPIHSYAYHGVNWVLTDGNILLAFCYTDPRGFAKSKALCHPKESYYQLRRKISKDDVLVASEPLDATTGWKGFRHGELLIALRRGARLVTKTIQVMRRGK